MTLSTEEQQIVDSAKKVSLTRAVVFKANQIVFERFLRTLELDFPEIYVIYKATSAGRLRIEKEA